MKQQKLFQYHSGSQLLELLNNGITLLFSNPFLQNNRGFLHQVFGFFQSQISKSPNFLDDLDFGSSIELLQLDVESRLLSSFGVCGGRPGSGGRRIGRRQTRHGGTVLVEAKFEPEKDGVVVPFELREVEKLVGDSFELLRGCRSRAKIARLGKEQGSN